MPPRPTSRSRTSGPAGRRPNLREQARGVYRDAILEAAAEVFAEHGHAGTRMQDVAARAGLAIGTLYNYFTNKDELTLSLLDLRGRQFVEQMEAMLGDRRAAADVVPGVVDVVLGHIEQHRALFAMFEERQLCAAGDVDRFGAVRARYQTAVRDALGLARRRGELAAGAPLADLETLLGGMLRAVAQAWIAGGGAGSLRERGPLVVQVFLHGVGRR